MLQQLLDKFFDYLDNGKVLVDSFVEGIREEFEKPEMLQREVEFLIERVEKLEKDLKHVKTVTGVNIFGSN